MSGRTSRGGKRHGFLGEANIKKSLASFFILYSALCILQGGEARPLPSAGARALAMGNAYVAEKEDVNVLFLNPAGLTGLTGAQYSGSYGRFDLGRPHDITEVHGAYGQPANYKGRPVGAAGGFMVQSIAPGVHVFDLIAGVGTDVPTQGIVPWPVRGGGALRIRQQKGGDLNPDVGGQGIGLGLDGGGLVEFTENLTLGAALRDLFTGGLHPPGPQLRLGGRYRHLNQFVILSDIEVRKNVTAFHIGMEWLLVRELLRLRTGNGFRSGSVDHWAFGAGFNYSPVQIDVAYLIPLKTFNDRTEQFRISLTYRFNAPKFSELYYDRALDIADDVDRRVVQLEEREAQLRSTVQDLEQARRLAEEDLARVSVRRTDAQRDLEERLLQAETRAVEAEKRARELEGKVTSAEEKIRRAGHLSRPAQPASPPQPKERYHTVQPGDSLRSLAEKYYKDPERWKTIYNANRDKVDRGRLIPGSKLLIPD